MYSYSLVGPVRPGHRFEVCHVREGDRYVELAPATGPNDDSSFRDSQEHYFHQEPAAEPRRPFRSYELNLYILPILFSDQSKKTFVYCMCLIFQQLK